MIFLSLKTYKEATGDEAIKLLSGVKEIIEKTKVKVIPVAQATDIYRIKRELGLIVWAQHIDPIDPGRHFGWLSPYSVKQAGAEGVVINHSEHKLSKLEIKKTIEKAKEYSLRTLVLTDTPILAIRVDGYQPDYLGYEKEEFIASGMPMIDQEKDTIRFLVKKIHRPLIIGAGITRSKDVAAALLLGASGVILSSAFVKAKNPKKKLLELVQPFSRSGGT
ncbi:MAG: triose-phosphate isomerase [Patescibacteria group bacterium]|nr:triose-phosphate isomerase [Patescibacteria group bacterium]